MIDEELNKETQPESELQEPSDENANPIAELANPSSRRQSLRNVRRQLTDDELINSGVQKMLLDMLEDAETEKDSLKNYVNSFHEVDKKAAILGEKLNADRSIEVFFGVGIGLGGAILGLSPYFGEIENNYGYLCALIGVILIIGSGIGRAVKR